MTDCWVTDWGTPGRQGGQAPRPPGECRFTDKGRMGGESEKFKQKERNGKTVSATMCRFCEDCVGFMGGFIKRHCHEKK